MSTLAFPASFTPTGGLNIALGGVKVDQVGARSFTADGKLRATTTAPTSITWVHGLPFNDDGELFVVDSGAATGAYRVNGILIAGSGAVVCVSEMGAVGPIVEVQGLKFDAGGAILVEGLFFSLNFLSNTLDPRVTFSRASNATVFDSAGNLVWAPHNICPRGNTFNVGWSMGSEPAPTVVGTLPSGRDAWLVTWESLSPTTGCVLINQPSVLGAEYALTIKCKYVNHRWIRLAFYSSVTAANQVRLWFDLQNGILGTVASGGTSSGASADTPIDLGGGWWQITLRGAIPWGGSLDASLLVATAADNGDTTRVGAGAAILCGEAVFELVGKQTPQTFRDEFATAGSAYYGPRLNYDPATLEPLGLLTEEARTNLSTFGTATAVSTGSATISKNATGPDGIASSCYTCTEGASNGFQLCNAQFSSAVTAGQTHVLSVFAKAGTNNLCQLATSVGASNAFVNFDLTTGEITLSGGSDFVEAWIFPCKDGWYRLAMAFVPAASVGASTFLAHILSPSAPRLPQYAGTGLTLLCGYWQTEVGSTPTSFIPTFSGVAATRAADLVTSSSVAWWNAAPAGAMLVDIGYIWTRAAAGSIGLVQLDDDSTSNRLAIRVGVVSGQSQATVVRSGVLGLNSSAGVAGFVSRKVAISWDATSLKMAVNGNVALSSAHGGLPAAISQLSVAGSTPGLGALPLTGHTRSIRGYTLSSILSDAELAAVTL